MVANADLAKVEHWYRMYQEQCLSEGKEIPDFQTMDMGKYWETGVMKEEAYVDTSSEAIRKRFVNTRARTGRIRTKGIETGTIDQINE